MNLDSRPCVCAVLIHRGNRLLMLNDTKNNTLAVQMTRVQREHMMAVLENNPDDQYLKTLRRTIDVDADALTSAYAYTALINGCKTFELDPSRVVLNENCCLITDHLLKKNTKGYNIKCFEMELGSDDIGSAGSWVDDGGLYSPNGTDLVFQDKKLTTMAGYMALLFFDHLF